MILQKILEHKVEEVKAAKLRRPLEELQAIIADRPPTRGFIRALRDKAATGTAIIAEVKKGSPSKGIICEDFNPVDIARTYEAGGAACLSILTDEKFFFGHLDFLTQVAEAVPLPLLRKDFLIDSFQLYEARACGADAILLIVAALSKEALKDLALEADELGLDVLMEVHDEAELCTALDVGVELIGVNNRNLNTFHTDIGVTERLLPLIPNDRFVVSESGIKSREDIERLLKAGARGFLIGESLMCEKDIRTKLASFLSS
jgi:indole-3-glycerol phosphate synthase